MKPRLFVPLLLVAAVAGGYVLGAGKGSTDAPAGRASETTSSADTPGHSEKAEGALIPGAQHIHAVVYDAEGNLLLGTHGGLFASKDAGKTWAKVATKGIVGSDDWMSLVVDPRDERRMFAGGHGLGVVKSADGGTTWARSDKGIRGTDIHGLTINQRHPDILFAYSAGNGIFRTTDSGESWQRVDDGPQNPGVRSLAFLAVQTNMDKSMGSSDPETWGVLAAGTADGLFQSFTCFCGWTKTTKAFDNTTVYTVATLHRETNVIYAGTANGAWKATDAGQTGGALQTTHTGQSWQQLGDLKSVKIAAIAINPKAPRQLTAVSESGAVYHSTSAGKSWKRIN